MPTPPLPSLPRRRVVSTLALAPLMALPALLRPMNALAAELTSLVVLPPDFLDDHQNPDPQVVAAQERRLVTLHRQLQDELRETGLYRIIDPTTALAATNDALHAQEFLYRCPDCIAAIGRAARADLAMSCWVQKVSELILNVNVELFRISSERSLLSKSVDMRGNQDASWTRAVHYLVRDMAERRAADPAYGL
jgi:hypothetical protein